MTNEFNVKAEGVLQKDPHIGTGQNGRYCILNPRSVIQSGKFQKKMWYTIFVNIENEINKAEKFRKGDLITWEGTPSPTYDKASSKCYVETYNATRVSQAEEKPKHSDLTQADPDIADIDNKDNDDMDF